MKALKRIYIEITNICNLNCSFCPPLERDKSIMSIQNFETIIEKVKPFTDYVYLHVKGEPLLHKDLATILELCGKHKLYANITTNGTKLYEVRETLYQAPSLRQINVSLHSFESITEENLDQLHLFLDEVICVVKHLRDHTNTITSLRLWNLDKTKDNASNIRNKLVLNRLQDAFSYCGNIKEELGTKRGFKLSERIYLEQDYEFAWPDLSLPVISNTGYCYGLKTQCAILVDGTVVPCCLDGNGKVPLGNILTDELDNILSSPRANAMREGFANRNVVEELCKRCGYRERF
ncbi:radical SAM/SPASM domain-containing protein [Anaeromicropila herbilytica]|uniref:Radical SAM domain protein n=1 Tax=Anaeromicropila herbilytica TaxID=2785025 RepID=A0A7R7EPZ7_9FIRM|nr:SPASM domain-containing protein [Anaeromicropila herbilytica]BCN32921.1 radical SAM domain protein [Anaeromicropila herbilytica]